jgi:hypothetical protein
VRRAHAAVESAAGLTPFGHLGWGYWERDEFFRRAGEYIVDGLRHNQYIGYAGQRSREALRAELADMPGVGEYLDSGRIEVTPTEDYYVYLPGTDVIDAEASVVKYLAGVEQAVASGYAGFRAVSDVAPVARTPEQRDALARLEYLIDQHMAVRPFSALCGYDMRELGAAAEELMCLHPFVSEGSTLFRLYAEPEADIDFALSGEVDDSADTLFATTLRRIRSLEPGHTLRIGAHDLQFMSPRQIFRLEEWAREQGRKVVLWTDQHAIRRLVDVLGLIHVRTAADPA